MGILDLVEAGLSWAFQNARGHDEESFCRCTAFSEFPQPTIEISSPDSGPGALAAPAQLKKEHSADGAGTFPSLEWKTPQSLEGKVKEWLLVSEDPDAPLPTPIAHGVYMGIAISRTSVTQSDFEVVDETKNLLRGAFHYGQARRPVVYIPPKPLLNHGPHRYFYEVVALSEPLPKDFVSSKPSPTREQVAENIQGKVLGWGLWVGSYERKWECSDGTTFNMLGFNMLP